MQVSPTNSPTKLRARLPDSPTKGPPRGFGLSLPGVERAGTPIPQMSARPLANGPLASLLGGSDSTKSSASASGGASGQSSSPGGWTAPEGQERKFRKSVTQLANKVERQAISRVYDAHSARTSSSNSPTRSQSPHGEDLDSSPAMGLTAQIREGARMHRLSRTRDLSPRAPASPTSTKTDDAIDRPWLSPRRLSRRRSEHNACKYPLSPVFEKDEASAVLQSPPPRRVSRVSLSQTQRLSQAALDEFIARGRSGLTSLS
jgi:hypothetical protein